MPAQRKPRFHDEECFGLSPVCEDQNQTLQSNTAYGMTSSERINSARNNFSNANIEAAVDDIISVYEDIARESATLAALRNQVLRELSTSRGWQSAPHPQALRLRRLTPSIPLNKTERLT